MNSEQYTFQNLITSLEIITKKLKDVEERKKKSIILEEEDLSKLKLIVLNIGKFIYLTDFEYKLVNTMLNNITEEEKIGKTDTSTYLKLLNFFIEENNVLKRENRRLKENREEIKKLLDK